MGKGKFTDEEKAKHLLEALSAVFAEDERNALAMVGLAAMIAQDTKSAWILEKVSELTLELAKRGMTLFDLVNLSTEGGTGACKSN